MSAINELQDSRFPGFDLLSFRASIVLSGRASLRARFVLEYRGFPSKRAVQMDFLIAQRTFVDFASIFGRLKEVSGKLSPWIGHLDSFGVLLPMLRSHLSLREFVSGSV